MRPLNLLGQTFRHEVAVASASARYLFNGWSWARDRKASSYHDHQADGIATRGDETELVEVELTPKAIERYAPIVNSHSWRISREGVTRVVYLCTADATRMVRREADKLLFRDDKSLIVTITAFDKRGTWIDSSGRFPEVWTSTPNEDANPNEILESRVIRARTVDGERPVPAEPTLLKPSWQASDPTRRRDGRRYRARYRDPRHHQREKRGFRTKREAEEFLAGVTVRVARGEYVDPAAGRVTVGELGVSVAR